MSDGFSILAESFRQKFFGRKFGPEFSRLQLVFLRKRFQILLQNFFIIFSFWRMFFLTSGGKFTAGLLKLHFFLVLRHLLSWLTSKILNMFQKLRILIENNLIFDERFPAALSKLHSNCPEEHLEGYFSSENTRNVLSNPNFWWESLSPFSEKYLARIPK